MKIELPEIFWLGNRERIMSIDFGENFELITGGANLSEGIFLRLWEISLTPTLKITHLDDLAGTHERSVNVVRFSLCKNFIASGSDDTCVVVWEKKKKPIFGEDRFEVGWGSKRVLRGHLREIHDLCWNNTGKYIASGSLDGSVIIFDVEKAKVFQRLEGNRPVHGVAWANNYLATLSVDRSLRIYEQGKKGFYIKHCIKEYESVKLFQDEVSSSAYFRKLAFSPNGLFLLTSAGIANKLPAVHCFLYQNYQYPSVSYPVNFTNNASALAVKFCPVMFKPQKNEVFKGLEVRMVWAVASKDCVILYNSDETTPIAAITNPHYSSITDICWYNENLLAVCSIDGYVSFIVFANESSTQDMEIDPESEPLVHSSPEVVIPNNGRKRIVPELINDI